MSNLDQIFNIINELKTSAQNLNRDIDQNDSREETKGDLKQLTKGFQQLQKLFSNVKQDDVANMQQEIQEWLSGQQDFQQCARDVNTIVMDIRQRTQSDGSVQQKIQENLPQQHQNQNIGDFFNNLKGVLDQVHNLTGAGR